jgi:5'-nucleotidase/UDP-sugar diphosphatase
MRAAVLTRRRWLVAAALACALPGCQRAPAALTILHFNDVYEIEPVEGGHAGGLARVATVRANLLRTAAPLVTTLGGDYLSPSAIGTAKVDGEPLAGRQMVDVLNAVGVDWATFGNHEFDLSEAAFLRRLAEQKFRIVSSNVTDANGFGFEGTVRSAVIPVHARARDLRIGLIGLTIDANQKPWVKYAPPVDAARAEISKIRAAGPVDAIVALTHLSLAEDQALVTAVEDIDLVLGGHEHENWMIKRGSRLTPIIKADDNVRSVAVVTLTFDRGDGRPSVSARLEVIDDRIAPDPAVDAIAKKWRTAAFDAFRREGFTPEAAVVSIPEPLDGREATVRNRPGLLTDILAASLLREAKSADVAIMNSGSVRIDDVLPPGPITQYDIIRILPFGGRVLHATFDGSLLAQVLDIGVKNQGTGGFLQTAGVARDGARWLVNGKPLNPAGRYAVAITDFLLTGGEANLGFLVRTNPHVHDVQELRDIRLAVIEELKARYGK